ncbi:hypothetical protein C1645_809286 [Glomus cerebriforme]|uniref:Uncharacterized protein n=1 Tax=Glomus cerebriforme TaxID=658196 RepID=A0A397SKH1_9GLOM|nr:hypothetical protein C1645_809286 [Glomus cerebriforme]
MNDLLAKLDYERICSLDVAMKQALEKKFITSGKKLMKLNLELEAKRLSYNQPNLDSIADKIWDSQLKESQKKKFTDLATSINRVIYAPTINDISRIINNQATNNSFETNFLKGTSFYGNN